MNRVIIFYVDDTEANSVANIEQSKYELMGYRVTMCEYGRTELPRLESDSFNNYSSTKKQFMRLEEYKGAIQTAYQRAYEVCTQQQSRHMRRTSAREAQRNDRVLYIVHGAKGAVRGIPFVCIAASFIGAIAGLKMSNYLQPVHLIMMWCYSGAMAVKGKYPRQLIFELLNLMMEQRHFSPALLTNCIYTDWDSTITSRSQNYRIMAESQGGGSAKPFKKRWQLMQRQDGAPLGWQEMVNYSDSETESSMPLSAPDLSLESKMIYDAFKRDLGNTSMSEVQKILKRQWPQEQLDFLEVIRCDDVRFACCVSIGYISKTGAVYTEVFNIPCQLMIAPGAPDAKIIEVAMRYLIGRGGLAAWIKKSSGQKDCLMM